MRALLALVLAGCSAPVEDCRVPSEVWLLVSSDRADVVTASPECTSGFCLAARPDASIGTCVQPCNPACPDGTHCVQVERDRLCLP